MLKKIVLMFSVIASLLVVCPLFADEVILWQDWGWREKHHDDWVRWHRAHHREWMVWRRHHHAEWMRWHHKYPND